MTSTVRLVKVGDPVEVLYIDGSDLSKPAETWVPATCCVAQEKADAHGVIGVVFADSRRQVVRWPGWRRTK